MRLDTKKIETLNKQMNELELRAEKIYERARVEGKSFNEMYAEHKHELHDIQEEIDACKAEINMIRATNINVGDGMSLSPYTDWTPYTVIERRDTPKGFVLTLQEDEAIRIDNNGMSDSQTYEYRRDPNGCIRTVRWNPRSNCLSADGYRIAFGRHAYHDYSF